MKISRLGFIEAVPLTLSVRINDRTFRFLLGFDKKNISYLQHRIGTLEYFDFKIKLSSSLQIYKYQNYNGEDFYLSVGKESNQISNWNLAERAKRRNEDREKDFCFIFYFDILIFCQHLSNLLFEQKSILQHITNSDR